MKKLGGAFLVLTVGTLSGLALVASAAGTTGTHGAKVRHFQQQVGALAIDGDRIAYDLPSRAAIKPHAVNKVLVWDVRTGKTVKVSGKKTAVADDTGGSGVFQLALAGSRVAWLVNLGGNLEATDFLYTSSVTQPKEKLVVSADRSGGNCPGRQATDCAGNWLGGLVGAGNTIALNRWATDSAGAVTSGGLYVLKGTQTTAIATGADTVQAASSNDGREAVVRSDGSVAVYAASGDLQMTVSPPSVKAVALSGKNLVVLTKTRQILLYDAQTGSLEKTFGVQGKNGPTNLDVQGNIAIYTSGSVIRAVNLTSGKDHAVGTASNRIALARIGSGGLAYATNLLRADYGKSTLVFVPMSRIKAAVG